MKRFFSFWVILLITLFASSRAYAVKADGPAYPSDWMTEVTGTLWGSGVAPDNYQKKTATAVKVNDSFDPYEWGGEDYFMNVWNAAGEAYEIANVIDFGEGGYDPKGKVYWKAFYSSDKIYILLKYDSKEKLSGHESVSIYISPYTKLDGSNVTLATDEVLQYRFGDLGGKGIRTNRYETEEISSVSNYIVWEDRFDIYQSKGYEYGVYDCSWPNEKSLKMVVEIPMFALNDTHNGTEFNLKKWQSLPDGISFDIGFRYDDRVLGLLFWNSKDNHVIFSNSYAGYLKPGEEAYIKSSVIVRDGKVEGGFTEMEAGATVTVIAKNPVPGKVFDRWISDDVTFADPTSPTTTFTMPTKDVVVTATYKDVVYDVRVTDGTANPSSGIKGTEVTLTPDKKDNYEFTGWNVTAGDVTVTDNKFIIGTADVAVVAQYRAIDKTVLAAAIAGAEAKMNEVNYETDYAKERRVAFESSFIIAKLVYEGETGQAEIDKAAADLVKAQKELVLTVGRKALIAAIISAEAKKKEENYRIDYTAEKRAAFEAALEDAKRVNGDAEATQAEIDKAVLALVEAQESLSVGIGKTALAEAIAAAEAKINEAGYANYTTASRTAFETALSIAKLIYDVEAKQIAIDKATQDLLDAQSALELVGMDETETVVPVLYPNPAVDNIVILGVEGVGYDIYGMNGQLVKSSGTYNGETIDISGLPSGQYYIVIDRQTLPFVKK